MMTVIRTPNRPRLCPRDRAARVQHCSDGQSDRVATVSVGLVSCVSTHLPSFDAWIVKASIFPSINVQNSFVAGPDSDQRPEINPMLFSNGGDKALRASAISAFVNVMDEACRVGLDARKVHFGTALYAINIFVQTLGLALTVWHFSTIIVVA